MNKCVITILVLLVTLVVAAGWLAMKRPSLVWAWLTRKALTRSGLKRVTTLSPLGPQTVFLGGTGPVLLLLHGMGDHAGTWARVVPALIKGHTLIVPDLAGHGASAPGAGPIEMSMVIAGLEAVVAAHAGDQPMTVVGNSLGAWVAMILARRQPGRIQRLVAVNGGPLAGAGDVNLLPATREQARETMARLRDPASAPVPDNVLDDLVHRAKVSPLARFMAGAASLRTWVMDEADLRALALPVRLVWGVSDQLMTMDYARRMLAALPDAELLPVERCGHLPQQEAPGRFLAALDQALAP